jgi:threonine dehydrogenase-like Zn-dependent dehydrogenase
MHAFHLAALAGVDVAKTKVAVVQGLGPVGCYAVMYLHAIGVETVYAITAGDNSPREELAVNLGAKEVFNLTKMGAEAVTKRLQQENGGLGVDLCFEASGSPKAVPQGIDILRNRGVYLVPGQYSNSGGIEIQPQLITFKAIHIIGSSQYSMFDVKNYLKFLQDHPELHETVLKLGNPYKVEEINQAFEDAKAGNNIKTMLVK